VSVPEMKAFIGLIINTGIVLLPDIKDYWSSEWTTQVTFVGDVMSRDRFWQIFRMMHVGNDTTEENDDAIKRVRKVHGVIKNIEKQFQKYFVPSKNIAIDESTVGFKGKIIFKTYNAKEPTKKLKNQCVCLTIQSIWVV
jgi:hypothetical protein